MRSSSSERVDSRPHRHAGSGGDSFGRGAASHGAPPLLLLPKEGISGVRRVSTAQPCTRLADVGGCVDGPAPGGERERSVRGECDRCSGWPTEPEYSTSGEAAPPSSGSGEAAGLGASDGKAERDQRRGGGERLESRKRELERTHTGEASRELERDQRCASSTVSC
eukprot:scaffold77466_cov26-Tisochrysis_lutea.AAC.4